MHRTGRGVPAAAALLALLFACGGGEADGVAPPRHVVLVVLDSVRADHVGAYGYGRPTTPRLDELAAGGLVFERAYAGSSATTQSLATLWTGRLPSRGGSTGLREAKPHPELLSLPRRFRRGGFRTGLATNLALLRERAFTRGFDEIEVDSQPGRWTGELVTEKGLELLDTALGDGADAFLLLAYADAGEPHLPGEEFRVRIDVPPPAELLSLLELRTAAGALPDGLPDSPGFRDLVARYDAELAHVDACLGTLVDGLESRGILDETLLVVTASHGTEFLDHGYVGSGWTLYEEALRVPLVVHAPGRVAPGRFAAPVSLADLVPTLERVVRLPRSAHELDGTALLAARSGGGLAPLEARDSVIAELVVPELHVARACIRGDWKLIDRIAWAPPGERALLASAYEDRIARMQDGELARPDPWGEPRRRELYDLAADPGEARDLGSSPSAFQLLAETLGAYERACRSTGLAAEDAARRAEVPEDADQLQQLGYL